VQSRRFWGSCSFRARPALIWSRPLAVAEVVRLQPEVSRLRLPPMAAPARPTLPLAGAHTGVPRHAQGSACLQRIMRCALAGGSSRSLRRRLRPLGMSPDDRRSADYESTGLSAVGSKLSIGIVSGDAANDRSRIVGWTCGSSGFGASIGKRNAVCVYGSALRWFRGTASRRRDYKPAATDYSRQRSR
jgi:hypothetical protein